MAILIDPPRWPAHGTRFSHLVSDSSLTELFEFADGVGIPVRAFDHDHYDVAEELYSPLVAAGAEPASERELLQRLIAGGLRVRSPERTPKATQVVPGLLAAWSRLLPSHPRLGRELLSRWQEPHRHYHDARHLQQMLAALELIGDGEVRRPVALAAWFHDAVYHGRPGEDEQLSAELAVVALGEAGLPAVEVAEVARLVLLTAAHSPDADDIEGQQLVDADLAVLGQIPGRYHVYARDVRLEYPDLPDAAFAAGRLRVLQRLRTAQPLFRTAQAQQRWAGPAAENLSVETRRWSRIVEQGR